MRSTLPRKNIIPGLAILMVSLVLIFFNPADNRASMKDILINTATRNIIPASTNDSQLLIYKKINDSLEKIIRWKKERITRAGSYLYTLFAGINRIDECDSCIEANEKNTRSKYFISLNGFALKPGASFLVDKNDYIIEKFVEEKKTEAGATTEQEKVRVRLVADPAKEGLTLLIPVSYRVFSWIEIFMYIFLVAGIIAGIWIFIRLPVLVLINIANGNPFLKKNIRYLSCIGWGIIGCCMLVVIFPGLIQLFLSSMIPNEIYYPFWSHLFDFRWGIFLGISVLLLARAFKQGYKLQQEQDLTI
ncbi:MAG TPA: DUF2975 domain-containing protein [Chitinophagaceae bacterium]|nr:DUF2975 domain-containing protein [Chitinophagaceae bacterium]